MNEIRNLCAQIPAGLHDKVREEKERTGKNLNQYITDLLTEYYLLKEKEGGTIKAMRTLAFQIPEELFQRIKAHLDRESASRGKKLTQRQFVLGLVEKELLRAEAETAAKTSADAENPQENPDTEENTSDNAYE